MTDAITVADIGEDEVYVSRRAAENNTFHGYDDCPWANDSLTGKDPAVLFDSMEMCEYCQRRWEDEHDEIVAWRMESKGEMSGDWNVQYVDAADAPDDPELAWGRNINVRNVRPLTWAGEEIDD